MLPKEGDPWIVNIEGRPFPTVVNEVTLDRTDFATQTPDQKDAITSHVIINATLTNQ